MSNPLHEKTFIVSTHYLIYSASQALRDFLLQQKVEKLLYISHPLPSVNPSEKERSYSELSSRGKINIREVGQKRFNSLLLTVFYEMFLTIKWVFNTSEKYDVYIGVDNLNALQGLILKKLHRVEKVVYYTIDYFPTRYPNPVLNWVYHYIDKICVHYADETWNVGKAMAQARQKHNNMSQKQYNKQYVVPIGIWYNNAPRKPFGRIDKKKLIFVGHLVAHMGVDNVIRALPKVLQKIPAVSLEIIGGGEELESLKQLAKQYKVEKYITFWGWIRDREKLEKKMASGAVGLATFNTTILDDKVKNADPGKIKDYMLLGMPVIVTNAISTAKELVEKQCAVVVEYDDVKIAHAIVDLLGNTKKLEIYRNNALAYIKQFDYGNIFQKNLERVIKKK